MWYMGKRVTDWIVFILRDYHILKSSNTEKFDKPTSKS